MAPINESSFIVDDYVPSPFFNTREIERMHAAPRAGNTNNITYVMTEFSNEQGKDYVKGMTVLSVLTFCLFVLWALVLVLFKCLGYKRVGWLSGSPPKIPAPPPSGDLSLQATQKEVESSCQEKKQDDSIDRAGDVESSEDSEEPDLTEGPNAATETDNSNHEDDQNQSCQNDGMIDALKNEGDGQDLNDVNDNKSETQSNDVFLDCIEIPPEIPASEANESAALDSQLDPSSFKTAKSAQDDMLNSEKSLPADATNLENVPESIPENQKGVPQEESMNLDEWTKKANRLHRLFRNSRIVILVCCLGILVVSALFIANGVHSLVDSVDNVQKGLESVDAVALGGIEIIDRLEVKQSSIFNATFNFIQNFSSFCPALEDEISDACQVLLDNSAFNVSNSSAVCTAEYIGEKLDEFAVEFSTFRSNLVISIDSLRDDLYTITDMTESITDMTDNFNWAFYVAAAFVVIYDICVLFLIYAVYCVWRGKHSRLRDCFRMAFVRPLVVLLLVLMWVFASVFAIGAVAGSDFCYDSPDHNVDVILQKNKDRFSSKMVFSLAEHYIKGCEGERPVQALVSYMDGVQELLLLLHAVLSLFSRANIDALSQECGVDMLGYVHAANQLHESWHVLGSTVNEVRILFFCENWYPIYDLIAREAACRNGVEGLAWVYYSCVAIGVLSMINFTIRFATSPLTHEEEEDAMMEGPELNSTSRRKWKWRCRCLKQNT